MSDLGARTDAIGRAATRPALGPMMLLAALLCALVACRTDEDSPPTPSVSPSGAASTPAAPPRDTPTPARTATATATATVGATPAPAARAVSGLFVEPRPAPQRRPRPWPVEPPSPFSPHDGKTLVLFDTQETREHAFGPGAAPSFSPDGRYLAWIEGDVQQPRELYEVALLELASMQQRSLGPARIPLSWSDARTLVTRVSTQGDQFARIDVETGLRAPATVEDSNPRFDTSEAGGYRLGPIAEADRDQRDYPFWRRQWRVTDLSGRLPPLEFEAYRAALAEDGVLFLATPPRPPVAPAAQGPHLEDGDVNVFVVNVETGIASFVASARAAAPNWPFDAGERYIAWTDNFCDLGGAEDDRIVVYDRRSDAFTAFEHGDWLIVTPRDELGLGQFGPQSLLDIATLRYSAVLPRPITDVAWSPDFRYAARGFAFGHGGLCG